MTDNAFTRIPWSSFLVPVKLSVLVTAKAKFSFVSFCSPRVQVDGNKLIFNNVRLPQETGVYQCVAENNFDMVVSSTWVNVLGNC